MTKDKTTRSFNLFDDQLEYLESTAKALRISMNQLARDIFEEWIEERRAEEEQYQVNS